MHDPGDYRPFSSGAEGELELMLSVAYLLPARSDLLIASGRTFTIPSGIWVSTIT